MTPHAKADRVFGPCLIPGCPTGSRPDETYVPIDEHNLDEVVEQIHAQMKRRGLS